MDKYAHGARHGILNNNKKLSLIEAEKNKFPPHEANEWTDIWNNIIDSLLMKTHTCHTYILYC